MDLIMLFSQPLSGIPEDGTVYSWGSNDWGQLGISDFEEERLERPDGKYLRDVPQLVGVMQGVRVLQLSAGAFHVVALSGTALE